MNVEKNFFKFLMDSLDVQGISTNLFPSRCTLLVFHLIISMNSTKSMFKALVWKSSSLIQKGNESLKDVYFKVSRPFSYHYNHEEFTVLATALNYTFGDLLNFPPLNDATMSDECKVRQTMFYNNS